MLDQLGLADEDDLEQLRRRRLEIRQEAHLLEHLDGEVLRLVDDQHRPAAARVSVEHVRVQRVHEHLRAVGPRGIRDTQLVADRREKLETAHRRVQDERDVDVVREMLQEIAAQRRLSGSDLPCQLNEAPSLGNAVQEMREPLPVTLAEIQEALVGRGRERRFGKAEVREIQRSAREHGAHRRAKYHTTRTEG